MKRGSWKPLPRRGVTAVLVVALIVVIGLVATSLARLSILAKQRQRTDEWQVQADWLVESGLERAWTQLVDDPEYRGEVWELSAEELSGRAGRVEIEALPEEISDSEISFLILAVYPSDASQPIRSRRLFQISTVRAKSEASP